MHLPLVASHLKCASLTLLVAATVAGQGLPRFHAFTIEETQVDWTAASAHGLNNRGSFTYTRNPAAGGGAFVRYSDGTVRGLSPYSLSATGDANGPQIDDQDRVCVIQSVQIAPNITIGRGALLYPGGNLSQIPPYSLSQWNEVGTDYSPCLGPGGHVKSGQAYHFDLQGGLVWAAAGYGYFSGLGGGTSYLPLQGFPANGTIRVRSTRPNVHGEWGMIIEEPLGAGRIDRLYRLSGSGQLSPMQPLQPGELSGSNFWQFNDRREFVCAKYDQTVGRYGAALLQLNGTFRFLNSKASGSPFVNQDGAGANVTPSPITLGYRQTLSLSTQAFAMLNGLLLDTSGYRLTDPNGGGVHINDVGQVLAMGYTPAGAARWLLLHPQPTPVLAIDIAHSRRNANARQDLFPQSGALTVKIVGGEPGQPNALFVRVAGTVWYIDGTLGLFDQEQSHEFSVPMPAFLRGYEFDLVAGGLDSLGILTSPDLRVTVQ